METFEPWAPARAEAIIADRLALEGPLLPVLHALQDAFGHVPHEAVPLVARALNLSRAEVHGVVSFYHDFRQQPPVTRRLQLCRAEACQARGAGAVAAALTAADVAVETVYCLGLCAVGPAALADGRPVARLRAADAARTLAR